MEALLQHFLRLYPAQAHSSPSCFAKVAPKGLHPTRNYPGPGLFQFQPSHQGGLRNIALWESPPVQPSSAQVTLPRLPQFSTPQGLPLAHAPSSSTNLPKLPGASILHRGCSHTRPSLTYSQKQRPKAHKMRSQEYVPNGGTK